MIAVTLFAFIYYMRSGGKAALRLSAPTIEPRGAAFFDASLLSEWLCKNSVTISLLSNSYFVCELLSVLNDLACSANIIS